MDLLQLPPFAVRTLALEAPGRAADRLDIVIPTTVEPGVPFDIRLAVLDAKGYPSVEYAGTVQTLGAPLADVPPEIRFRQGEPAVAVLGGARLVQPGCFRVSGDLEGQTFHSNPCLCRTDAGPQVFWGDPHVHSVLSRCHPEYCRSLNFCFSFARYGCGLDWVSAADHVSNGRCDLSKWKEQTAVANQHNAPPDFVTLPAYEASLQGGAGGDNNVYMTRFPAMFVDAYDAGDVNTLHRGLSELLPEEDFLIVPHHTTRTGKHGEIPDDIYPGPDCMPLIEIHSKWGTSEYRGNPNPLRNVHPGPSYAADLLARGLQLGFVAGTDTHATMAAGGGDEPPSGHLWALPGFTAIQAPALSRRHLIDAMKARSCYATSGERIAMDVKIAGAPMGQTVRLKDPEEPVAILAFAAAKEHIVSVEIVRNGETIETVSPDDWRGAIAFQDTDDSRRHARHSSGLGASVCYYVRVKTASGSQAWSSPVWVCVGE